MTDTAPASDEAAPAEEPHRPSREVTATPGWPPIALPGRPGWYRHLVNGEQVDLPTNTPPAEGT